MRSGDGIAPRQVRRRSRVLEELLEAVFKDDDAGRLDRRSWSCMTLPLRMALRWQGISLWPLPFV